MMPPYPWLTPLKNQYLRGGGEDTPPIVCPWLTPLKNQNL